MIEWRSFHGIARATDVDVLVIGGGLGGAFAAIKAKDAGAEKVLLVEKGYFGYTGARAFAGGVIFLFVPEEDDRGTPTLRRTQPKWVTS